MRAEKPNGQGAGPRGGGRRRLALPLALMLAITVSSHQEIPVDLSRGSDKAVHGAVYALLSWSWLYALAPAAGGLAGGCAASGALATLWGGVDELHQSFVPGRDASAGDLAADAAGAGIAALCGWALMRLRAGR